MVVELTVREAARRVGRADETIRRWIWSGRLPARKLGNTYRVLAHDVDAAVQGVPTPRTPDDDELERRQSLGEWLERVREWQADNKVTKRPGAWRLVAQDRAERSELADR